MVSLNGSGKFVMKLSQYAANGKFVPRRAVGMHSDTICGTRDRPACGASSLPISAFRNAANSSISFRFAAARAFMLDSPAGS